MIDVPEQTCAPASMVTWQSLAIAFALHALLFLLFWGFAFFTPREEEKKEPEIIPIDLTIVPPWAKKTDDLKPDPRPPPPKQKAVKPPKTAKPEKVKEEVPLMTGLAVEQVKVEPEKEPEKKPEIKPEKKPEKKPEMKRGDLKNKAKLQKTPPKPQKPEPKLKDTAKLNKVPAPPAPPPPPDIKIPDSVRDFGKGTASEDPLKNIDMKKMLEQGYRYGARNQLATSEEQLCLSLIKRAINREWDKESFNYHEGLRNIQVKLQLGIDGKVRGFMVLSGSGDADVDRTAHNALTRLRGTKINGLTEQFLTKYPELNTVMEPKMGH